MSTKKTNTAPVAKTEEVKVALPGDTYELSALMKELVTKSAVIRKLSAEGFTRADISRFMGIRYQHVRNVLVNDALKAATEK